MPKSMPAQRVPLIDVSYLMTTQWFRFFFDLFKQVGQVYVATATLDFPNTAAGTSSDLTVTVPGAQDGDIVCVGVPNACVLSNSCYTGWVSAADTVTVRFNNYSSGAQNPASGDFNISVTRY